MNYLNPIYTEKTKCEDCYKCLRNCPVKAIKVESGAATVIPELCICCGHCVEVCPNGAKRVRDDLGRARQLLASGRRVYVSLAPSFIAEYPNVKPEQLVAALRKLGFAGVSETALGAQEVSAAVGALLAGDARLLISTACPTVVDYLQKHDSAFAAHCPPLLSPLLTHCRMLRAALGNDVAIVFIGPCIAKKLEADRHPELLDLALTFDDLRRWLESAHVEPALLTPTDQDQFASGRATDGAWYPIDGGMIAGVKANCQVTDGSLMSFSGIPAIQKALAGLEGFPKGQALFLELLACEGGCVNGPRAARRDGTATKRRCVLGFGKPADGRERRGELAMGRMFHVEQLPNTRYPEARIREALRSVGKYSADDELNCGGCGYESCMSFGEALLAGNAERMMCVTYMRKLAQKKANALIAKMPSAVVIVGEGLKILECNAAFVGLFAKSDRSADEAIRALEGVPLASVVPFSNLFASILRSGEDFVERDIRFSQTILHAAIFTIEKHSLVGAIIQDITRPAVQKEQVIKKAREVIQKNLSTVQQIAYLLGENAADSEITLNQIIDSFTPAQPDEVVQKNDDWRKLYRR